MQKSETLIYPVHYRLVVRRNDTWHFTKGDVFVNLFNVPILEQKDLFAVFGTTMKEVASELRRINNGHPGFYIADIKNKKYYYCGPQWSDVKAKLQELGVGRPDPMEA
jgi:3'-phosphoadenosine 5'-phosphosulfate sulfotransferase